MAITRPVTIGERSPSISLCLAIRQHTLSASLQAATDHRATIRGRVP